MEKLEVLKGKILAWIGANWYLLGKPDEAASKAQKIYK